MEKTGTRDNDSTWPLFDSIPELRDDVSEILERGCSPDMITDVEQFHQDRAVEQGGAQRELILYGTHAREI